MPGPMTTGGYDPAYASILGMTPGFTGAGSVAAPPGTPAMPSAMPFQFNMPQGQPTNPLPIPPMQVPNYNTGGGYMPTQIGGQWNQLAQ